MFAYQSPQRSKPMPLKLEIISLPEELEKFPVSHYPADPTLQLPDLRCCSPRTVFVEVSPAESLFSPEIDSSHTINQQEDSLQMEASVLASPTPSPSTQYHGDLNKIMQWYCCECGQSYGSFVRDDRAEGGVSFEPPSRYSCHRCYHMMCPYCLKQRVKDFFLSL